MRRECDFINRGGKKRLGAGDEKGLSQRLLRLASSPARDIWAQTSLFPRHFGRLLCSPARTPPVLPVCLPSWW